MTTQEFCEQYWTSPGGNTPQGTNCTATCLLLRKLFKLDEPDMRDTAGKAGPNSCDVLLWTPTHGRAKAGRQARTYIQQLCEDTGCCPEDLPEAMSDREKCRGRVRDIRATSTTWWWWWWWYQLNGYRGLNSFEKTCFTLVATITSLAGELNPTFAGEHIYCHRQTVSFYQNSSVC